MAYLRIATAGDAPEIAAIYGPLVEQTAISFEVEAPSVEEIARRIESTLEHRHGPPRARRGGIARDLYEARASTTQRRT